MKHDPVNRPAHYISESGLECVEVIEAFASGNGHRSQAIKYLLRAGRKGGPEQLLEDLRKACWWIDREICFVRAQRALESGKPKRKVTGAATLRPPKQ